MRRFSFIFILIWILSSTCFAGWVDDVKKYHSQGLTQDAWNVFNANLDNAMLYDADNLQKSGLTGMAQKIYYRIADYAQGNKVKAEAWFGLGNIQARELDKNSARSFNKAIVNHPGEYDSKITLALKQAGLSSLTKGNTETASFFAREATEHGASGSAIASEYRNKAIEFGKNQLKVGNLDQCKKMLGFAIQHGYSSNEASQMIMEIGHGFDPGEQMVSVYRSAYVLNPTKTEDSRQAGKRVAAYARSIENPGIFNENIQMMIDLAISMSKTDDCITPYVRYFEEGEIIFPLFKNEWSKTWYRQGKGKTKYGSMATNMNFEVHFSDGKIVKVWRGEKFPNYVSDTWRYKAIDDVTIKLIATK